MIVDHEIVETTIITIFLMGVDSGNSCNILTEKRVKK